MGQFFSNNDYNIFNIYGQYNVKKQLFEKKKFVLFVLLGIIGILIATIIMLWTSDADTVKHKIHYSTPSAKRGMGPDGYGVYLPSRQRLAQSLLS